MELTPFAMVMVALLLAVWTAGAAWLAVAAANRAAQAEGSRKAARRMSRMIDESPAIPLLVRADGKLEGPDRLAGWLGLETMPHFLSELAGEDATENAVLPAEQARELAQAVRRAQKTAAPFRMVLNPKGSQRSLAVRGSLADPQVSPGGAALLWLFDFSESETELGRLREQADRARGDFGALVGLIEAAPMPMWFREPSGALRLVNRAYVEAVGGTDADAVVAAGTELVEPVKGEAAADIARQALQEARAIERTVSATINGQRRSLRVSDLPLGDEGIAGYAVDIEEMEEQSRAFRAFREAQRTMLDQLSIGVAQFDAERQIAFANQPFRRIFNISPGTVSTRIPFDRLLNEAREAGRLPEVRDFPEWRGEHLAWFASGETQEEAWPLPDGTHLRIVGQPMPDGGLVLIAEDRTEQLALSATRDTLLRTRTAIFDSLFEALAVFAPDGRLQLWNRSFTGTWGLESDALKGHPSAEDLLAALRPNLAKDKQADHIGEVIRAATLDRKETGGRLMLQDGRTLEYAGVPLPDGNGLLTVLDITDSQKAEDALRERNQALEQADQVKTRFLANMSYELRTPLTSIGGFAELLQSGVAGELSEQGVEYVDAIVKSVDRLTEQVENVLDLSQSQAGLLPIKKQQVELMPLLTRLVRERQDDISRGGLKLDLRGKPGVRIDADVRQLGRAVAHLLDNSITATGDGGKILVDLSKQEEGVRIVVSDNGAGMTDAELRRALDGRANAGDDSQRKGLGIPLSRQLVEAHGGTLDIQSEKGVGTAAIIHLP
ncbi:Sensor protein DivL [Alteripontixanthobacter maritimus]|uniref:histidine kinase n=1 Tax=Alteripontixanthobacter maritimus TaxID=2161824 RepID=A0A369Q5G0_9SPHN|nr:PAS domain-containing sensor histidine kinase [Alteripontixanthobacter maritimus]RDC59660.1 Sensor protein DivL [Alteripontixanthobacter maritimus]